MSSEIEEAQADVRFLVKKVERITMERDAAMKVVDRLSVQHEIARAERDESRA